jgi:predicted MFS family arabinose efflux permease
VLLAAFAVIETRSRHALLPLRLLADRNRTGANLMMLCVGAAIFGIFFFLTVFMQSVWGYSALKTGLAYLPLTAGIMVGSGAGAQLIPRVGARPLLLVGAPTAAGGLYWLSRLGEHSSYAGAVLGPMLVIAVGFGLLFVPLTLVAMSRVADEETGVAASLRNTGQQVYHHALAAGFSRAFLVASGVMLLGLIIAIVAIRVRRADLGEARF